MDNNGNGNGNGKAAVVDDDASKRRTGGGLRFDLMFGDDGLDVEFADRTAEILTPNGSVIFRQEGVRFPKGFSQTAAGVIASKYFYGDPAIAGGPVVGGRERGFDDLVSRITTTIVKWGIDGGYFSAAEGEKFGDNLSSLLIGQYAAFNSPVWFNCGLWDAYGVLGDSVLWRWDDDAKKAVRVGPGDAYKHPQCSACFIQGVNDDMESIMDLAKSEAMLFKMGSGTGTDLSTLRSTREKLSGGGKPSGPVSFFKVFDAVAGAIKSGGKCLAPEQLVFTAEGGAKTAAELADAGGEFVVLSYSKRLGRVAAKRARAWWSGSRPMVDVVTDKGVFSTSADHPFVLRTGQAVFARDLVSGRRLLASHVSRHSAGYHYVRVDLANKNAKRLLHRLIAEDVLGWPSSGVVHHVNGDVLDGRPDNLRLLSDQAEHAGLHAEQLVAVGEHIFQTRTFPKVGEANGMHGSSAFWADAGRSADYRRRKSRELVDRGNATDMQRLSRRRAMLDLGYFLINAGYDISTYDGYLRARYLAGRRSGAGKAKQLAYIEKHFGSYAAYYKELGDGNHVVVEVIARPEGRVVSIEVIDDEPDDKRDWSEHNYAILPAGSTDGFGGCVFVLNTRRAARMQSLMVTHPDVVEFIDCKLLEDRKARALIAAGYSAGMTGAADEAYSSVAFQNTNTAIRYTDEFMAKASGDDPNHMFSTLAVTDGRSVERLDARRVLDRAAAAVWECGDPGVQFHDTINRWNPVPNSGAIHASNPCVTGDTLVSTAEGYRRIDELVGEPVVIVDRDGAERQVARVFKTGVRPVFRLTTRSGYSVRLTADHRVLTSNRGDVAASELTADDWVVLNPVGFGPESLDVEFAEVVGLMVGDGCVSRSAGGGADVATLTMNAAEESNIVSEVRERIRRLKAGETDGRGRREANVGEGGLATVSRLATGSRRVVELLGKYAVLDRGSAEKQFKSPVFLLDRESIAGLLRGLFTADGCVYNYGDKTQAVSLDSASLPLLRQVQLLLLGFGVKSKLYTNRRPKRSVHRFPDGRGGFREYAVKPQHSLRISRSSRVVFAAEIGFWSGGRKQAKLDELNQTVSAYADPMRDRVAAVEAADVEDVFDLTEPVTSHFGANGLVVHNCGEYNYINNTACNLASLNLLKFVDSAGVIDVNLLQQAVRTLIVAQEILVDAAGYPTAEICRNSHEHRPLGLGFANLGALLMTRGLPYDSDAGRDLAGAISAVIQARAAATSAELAAVKGAFPAFDANRDAFHRVMGMHVAAVAVGKEASRTLPWRDVDASAIWLAAERAWDREALPLGGRRGYRNGQFTVQAPTGTIALAMDCDTMGIEPAISLVADKTLSGGGSLRLVNQSVPVALNRLGYTDAAIADIVRHVDKTGMVRGAPWISDQHLAVFDCALSPSRDGAISTMGHVKMMAAIQPHVSGALSKTTNVPAGSTVADIRELIVEGHRLGLKALAIYRDGSKGVQPLNVVKVEPAAKAESTSKAATTALAALPRRERLPDTRQSVTHKFDIQGHKGYVTVGLYPDGRPGEVFVTMAKAGSTVGGLMDSLAASVSIGLQYGVPLDVLVHKFEHARFEPAGFTKNQDIPIAKSVVDYLFRWLAMRYVAGYREANSPVAAIADSAAFVAAASGDAVDVADSQTDAPPCDNCGAITMRAGTCYLCGNCGATTGCG